MENEGDVYTNCNMRAYNGFSRAWQGSWKSWKSGQPKDHPNYCIVKIGQYTENSPGDLSRLAVTQTSVKYHQLTVVWKKDGNNIYIYIYIYLYTYKKTALCLTSHLLKRVLLIWLKSFNHRRQQRKTNKTKNKNIDRIPYNLYFLNTIMGKALMKDWTKPEVKPTI